MKKYFFVIGGVLAVFSALLSCQKSTKPPLISDETYESCRRVRFEPRSLEASQIRGLINCLNEKSGAVSPYRDLLDSLSDEEINSSVVPWNSYARAGSKNFNLLLGFFDRLRDRGHLKQILRDLGALYENGTLESALEFVSNLDSHGLAQANLGAVIGDLVVDSIRSGDLEKTAVRAAQLLSSPRLAMFSERLARPAWGQARVIEFDEAFELSVSAGLASTRDQSLNTFFFQFFDPVFLRDLRFDLVEDRKSLSHLVAAVISGSGDSEPLLKRLGNLVKQTDREFHCVSDGGSERYIPNLYDVSARRIVELSVNQSRVDVFLVRDTPLLLNLVSQKCDMSTNDRLELQQFSQAISDLVRRGGGRGLSLVKIGLVGRDRQAYLKKFVQNPHVHRLQPVIEVASQLGYFELFFEMLSQDFSSEDVNAISTYVLKFFLGSSSLSNPEDEIVRLLSARILSEGVVRRLREYIDLRSSLRGGLSELVSRVDRADIILSRDLRAELSRGTFTNSPYGVLKSPLSLMLESPEGRKVTKVFLQKISRSLFHSGGELGDLVHTLAEAMSLMEEDPVQDLVRTYLETQTPHSGAGETLTWESVFRKTWRSGHLKSVLLFTAKLSTQGELGRLLDFLVQLFKYGGLVDRGAESQQPGYQRVQGPAPAKWDIHGFPPLPLAPNFARACGNIRGDVLEPSGVNLRLTMECFDSVHQSTSFGDIASRLEARGQLGVLADVLANTWGTQESLNHLLRLFEHLDRRGSVQPTELQHLVDMFVWATEEPYKLQNYLDPLLGDIATQGRLTDRGLECVGRIQSLSGGKDIVDSLISVMSGSVRWSYQARGQYRMPMFGSEERLRREARALFSEGSEVEFESKFQQAIADFKEHGDRYLFREGVFERKTDQQIEDLVVEYLVDFARNTNLEEFVRSFKAIAGVLPGREDPYTVDVRDRDVARFIENMITGRRVVEYRTGPEDHQRVLRIVTPLAQFELFALNGDFDIVRRWPFGSDHVGLNFLTAVSESRDLVSTIDNFKSRMENALRLWFPGAARDKKARFRNFKANINVLEETAQSGDLRIFQRILQGFYISTPERHRRTEDPHVNEQAMVLRALKMGLLTRLTPLLTQLHEQGKLREVVAQVLNIARILPEVDEQKVHNLYRALIRRPGDGISVVRQFVREGIRVGNNSLDDHMSLKVLFLDLLRAIPKLGDRMTGLFVALQHVFESSVSRDAISEFIEQAVLGRERSFLSKTLVRLQGLSSHQLSHLWRLTKIFWLYDHRGELSDRSQSNACSVELTDLALGTFRRYPNQIAGIWNGARGLLNESRVEVKDIPARLRSWNNVPRNIGSSAPFLLSQQNRSTLMSLMRALSEEQAFHSIFTSIAASLRTGTLQDELRFLARELRLQPRPSHSTP